MAIKIRLARGGSKKRPFYRIVAADSRMPRDGRFIERLGTYNPLLAKDSEDRVICCADAAREAQQIARLERLAEEAGLDPEFAKKFMRFIVDEVIHHHQKFQK